MKALRYAPLALTAVLGWNQTARADVAVVKTDDLNLNLGAMAQTFGQIEHVNDIARDSNRAYFYMKTARVRANGTYKDFGFNLEMALGGEDVVAAPSPGIGLSLLDMNVDVPVRALGQKSFVKVGQFKVPYGREALTYSGTSMFVDRSLDYLGFEAGRDVGATLNLRGDKSFVTAGFMTGGGRDVPQRYLPEKLGIPMLVLRAGLGNIDEDLYALKQTNGQADGTRWGVAVNALYTKDTQIGHSTALNVKMSDKNLLINGGWNPFIGKTPFSIGQWWQAGADAAVRTPLTSGVTLSAEGEFNYGEYTNGFGTVTLAGGRVQGAVSMGAFDAGIRYSVLFPDQKMAVAGKSVVGSESLQEVTPALTYHLNGNNLKLVADLPILLNTPVANEKGIGTYVLAEMPGETSVLAKEGNSITRQTVTQARLMLQAWF